MITTFGRRIASPLSAGLLLLLTFVLVEPAFADRPNVIVVMTDDQGYGEFSCNGNPIVKTTNIDALAAQSLRMTDFHAAPMCTPTRAQLMTGLDAFRTSAINVSSGRTLLNPKLKTMANVFGDAGYRTGIFGKWHLGDNYPFRPGDRGFQEALWFPSSHINSVPDFWDNDYFDDTYIHRGVRKKYSGYCTDVFFDEAMSWMENGDEKPFFAYLPLNAAHYPWFAPEKYRDPIRKAIAANPEAFSKVTGKGGRNADNLTSFLAMGANIDENMGRLDAFLKENGLFDNTIVVFLTDNGSDFGDSTTTQACVAEKPNFGKAAIAFPVSGVTQEKSNHRTSTRWLTFRICCRRWPGSQVRKNSFRKSSTAPTGARCFAENNTTWKIARW